MINNSFVLSQIHHNSLPFFSNIVKNQKGLLCLKSNVQVQWVLGYPNPDYPYPDIWTSAHVAIFSIPAGKKHCGHWSFAMGESKAAVRTTFLNATALFPSSIGVSSQFTTSELAERSRKLCSTLYN